MNDRLDADTATERGKHNGAKLPHEKTGCAGRKGGRDKEERGTPKPAAREKSLTGNPGNPTAKREAITPQTATSEEPQKPTLAAPPPNEKRWANAPNCEPPGTSKTPTLLRLYFMEGLT